MLYERATREVGWRGGSIANFSIFFWFLVGKAAHWPLLPLRRAGRLVVLLEIFEEREFILLEGFQAGQCHYLEVKVMQTGGPNGWQAYVV